MERILTHTYPKIEKAIFAIVFFLFMFQVHKAAFSFGSHIFMTALSIIGAGVWTFVCCKSRDELRKLFFVTVLHRKYKPEIKIPNGGLGIPLFGCLLLLGSFLCLLYYSLFSPSQTIFCYVAMLIFPILFFISVSLNYTITAKNIHHFFFWNNGIGQSVEKNSQHLFKVKIAKKYLATSFPGKHSHKFNIELHLTSQWMEKWLTKKEYPLPENLDRVIINEICDLFSKEFKPYRDPSSRELQRKEIESKINKIKEAFAMNTPVTVNISETRSF